MSINWPTESMEFVVTLSRLTDGVSYSGEVTATFDKAIERATEAFGSSARIITLYPKEHGLRVVWADYVFERLEHEATEADEDAENDDTH